MTVKYRPSTIWLHWIAAILIIAMAAAGKVMADLDVSPQKALLYRGHAFAGLIVLALTLVRIVLLFRAGRPAPDPAWPGWMVFAARATHYGLHALLLALAASGIATMALSGLGGVLVAGDLANWPDLDAVAPANAHRLLANLFLLLLAAHVAAALYHQFWRRDRIFARISPLAERGGTA